jgi:hypothetical protein
MPTSADRRDAAAHPRQLQLQATQARHQPAMRQQLAEQVQQLRAVRQVRQQPAEQQPAGLQQQAAEPERRAASPPPDAAPEALAPARPVAAQDGRWWASRR